VAEGAWIFFSHKDFDRVSSVRNFLEALRHHFTCTPECTVHALELVAGRGGYGHRHCANTAPTGTHSPVVLGEAHGSRAGAAVHESAAAGDTGGGLLERHVEENMTRLMPALRRWDWRS